MRQSSATGIHGKIIAMFSSLHALIVQHGQFIRFLISGGTAFLANLVLIYLFTDMLHVWYLLSSVFAFVGAFVVSFSLQKFWTFKNREVDRMSAQLGLSLMTALFNLGVNTALMYLLVEYAHLHYLTAVVCTTGIIAVETFFVYKYIIFSPSSPNVSHV